MKGTHGTCVSRAKKIQAEGFSISPVGLRGSGVYFWGYSLLELESYMKELAIAWWHFAKEKRGDYAKEHDKNCCVVYASFEGVEFFDFENQQIREKFIKYADEMLPKINAVSEDKKISTLYDMFVEDIEKKIGKKFNVVHVKVQQPKGFKQTLPLDVTGQPSCYVVRDVACVRVDKFEEM